MLKEKQTSKNISINQEPKNNSKKIKKTAAKLNVSKETQTLPQESSNDLKIDLDLEADKLIAEANNVTEEDIDLDDDDDNASVLSSAQEAAAKALASIKIGPKGVYTEDSIRVYLQEIGRIRLLRPDEEIELARKIADLLQIEEEAAQFESENGHFPSVKEWAVLADMPLTRFRRRLMLGRRAKEKMVQSNLRLVVSIAKKYMLSLIHISEPTRPY